MPYHLSEDGLCVLKEDDETVKCHDTHDEAVAHLAVLELNVEDAKSIKLGARNSAGDLERLQEIHNLAVENGADCQPAPNIVVVSGPSKPLKADLPALMITLPDIPGAVKALGDWELEVLGVPFGGPNKGKDTDGQFFSANTNTYGQYFKTIPVYYYHSVNPDGRSYQDEPALIGTAKYMRTDSKGHWYKVSLNKAVELARRMWEAAKRGIARASSGSLAHIVRVGKDGEILHWPVAELSLIDAEGRRQPANAWAVATPIMQANYTKAKLDFPVIPETANDPDKDAEAAGKADRQSGSGLGAATKTNQGVHQMDEIEVKATVAAALKEQREADAAAVKAESEKQEAIKAGVAKEIEAMKAEAVKGRRLPFMDTVTIAKQPDLWKYDNLDAGDLAVLMGTLKADKRLASPAAYKALAVKLEADKSETGEVGRRAMKSAGIKADELDYSTSTGYGDDWVGITYSQALWASIRADTFIVNKLPQVEVPQGSESIYLPLESTDPTWYKVAQATSLPSSAPESTIASSRVATTDTSLTVSKLGARVMWSGELDEDSMIPFASQLRQQLATSGSEYLESLIIDGDTTTGTSANINYWGSSSPAVSRYFLAFNGLRHSALITTTANARAGGALTVEDYLETVKLMGAAGINGMNTSKTGFIIDPWVNYKTLALPELLTKDVYSQPTIEGGKITNIWGYDVFVSGSMNMMSSTRKTNSGGVYDNIPAANNVYGTMLAVRWDQWKFGWKRRMTMETSRIARNDATEIVALLRCGLIQRDTEAVALTFGISV